MITQEQLDLAQAEALQCAEQAWWGHFDIVSPSRIRQAKEDPKGFAKRAQRWHKSLSILLGNAEKIVLPMIPEIERACATPGRQIAIGGYAWSTAHRAAVYTVELCLNSDGLVDYTQLQDDPELCRELIEIVRRGPTWDLPWLETEINGEWATTSRMLASRPVEAADHEPKSLTEILQSKTGSIPTPLQQQIWDALEGKQLKIETIADRWCGGDHGRLYKKGGLKELKDLELVNVQRGRGYYRPDAPPLL